MASDLRCDACGQPLRRGDRVCDNCGRVAEHNLPPSPTEPWLTGTAPAPSFSGPLVTRQETHPAGGVVLALGLFGLFGCLILSPFAWVMANKALVEIDAEPGRYLNRGVVALGKVLGIVGTVVLCLMVGFFVLVFGVSFALGFSSGSDGGA